MPVRPHSLYKATAIIPWICDPRVWYPYICPFSKYRIGNTNRVQFTSCNLPLQWFWLRKHLFTSLCLRWGRTPLHLPPRPSRRLFCSMPLPACASPMHTTWDMSSPQLEPSHGCLQRKIIRMSAPVSSLPQKNSPPPGEAAS